jgi:crotonobetainyl-CoA:carnitine CoA-transferase CaiB-like acyl-CoA transferase
VWRRSRGGRRRVAGRIGATSLTGRPPGPLAGILVVDCSTVLAGPYCTMLLADLGAEVIKVEPPEGDGTRAWGPPWVGAGRLGPDDPGVAAYYLAINRNKRSIRLDLRTAAGAEVLRGLIVHADILVENFRVGGFERLGFSDAALESLNRHLIHLAISGYGTTGPDAAKPGYDFVIQAVAGLMSITGFPDANSGDPSGGPSGGPTKVGVAIADVIAGILGSTAVLAALEGRGRPDSPAYDQGQRIDLSLFESSLAVLINQAQNAFATGRSPGRRGNAHPNIVPYETFATADGQIAVAVGSERQWARFCACLGTEELVADPRFATNADRVAQRDQLRPILAARFALEPTAAWLDRLETAEIPCGPIQGILEALASEQAQAREMTVEVQHPLLGALRQVGVPFKLAATPATVRSAPPLLGEHSDQILAELGYDAAAIERLRTDDVI